MRQHTGIAVLVFFSVSLALAQTPTTQPSNIEHSKPLENDGGLSTIEYPPTAREAEFLEKVNEGAINHWAGTQMPPPTNGPRPTPAEIEAAKKAAEAAILAAKAYTLQGQAGKYVGWFGIVRAVHWDEAAGQTTISLQHCHFDGLIDAHQQIVSVYGAGDFDAVVNGKVEGIPPLSLIRAYGAVSVKDDQTVSVVAEYIRVWECGLFAFMDYGIDKTNPKWKALRKLSGHDVYTARPDTAYYESVLGKPD